MASARGGLFEFGGMGASDHAMALALVGKADQSAPRHTNHCYLEHLQRWQDRIQYAVHGRIGYVPNVISHRFHGRKRKRGYLSPPSPPVDGGIGVRTLAAVKAADPHELIVRMCETRLAHMRTLPAWAKDGRGWTDRVTRIKGRALSLIN